jgi:hypothetical protein
LKPEAFQALAGRYAARVCCARLRESSGRISVIASCKRQTPRRGQAERGVCNRINRPEGPAKDLTNPVFAHPERRSNRGVPIVTDYTIAAIPTVYRGRRYRSRLEARWAAFFDLLGWRHEYEPFDLGAWSPDFLLPDWNLLTEVKPMDELDSAEWEKAVGACERRGLLHETADRSALNGVLMLGVAPRMPKENGRAVRAGWIGLQPDYDHAPAFILWRPHQWRPAFTADLVAIEPGGWRAADGDAGPDSHNPGFCHYDHHTMELWAAATNRVQWHPETRT